MMIIKAKVRRGGELLELPAEQLVPGDIVSVEAGDIVPADGRLLSAATLEVAESALTGKSVPVSKGIDAVSGEDVPLGDRTDMVFMNTNTTRGTGQFVVTATGMATEVGHTSNLLQSEDETETPLTRQLAKLTNQILFIAGAAVALSMILNLSRGETFKTVFTAAIAFAVSAIPTGLPAVVTTILSLGTQILARGGRRKRRRGNAGDDAHDLGCRELVDGVGEQRRQSRSDSRNADGCVSRAWRLEAADNRFELRGDAAPFLDRGALDGNDGPGLAAHERGCIGDRADGGDPAGSCRELTRCPNLWTHGACCEIRLGERLGTRTADRALLGRSPVRIDGVDVRDDCEYVHLEVDRQQRARKILVDHGLHTHEPTSGRDRLVDVRRRDAAAARTDHDAAALEQSLDRLDLEDPLGSRRGHDAAEAVAVGLEPPPLLRLQAGRLLGVVERSDRLSRVREGRVIRVDLDLCQQGGEVALERELVAELLLDDVADHPLGLRIEDVKGIRLDFRVRRALECEQADLWAIAV